MHYNVESRIVELIIKITAILLLAKNIFLMKEIKIYIIIVKWMKYCR